MPPRTPVFCVAREGGAAGTARGQSPAPSLGSVLRPRAGCRAVGWEPRQSGGRIWSLCLSLCASKQEIDLFSRLVLRLSVRYRISGNLKNAYGFKHLLETFPGRLLARVRARMHL